MNIKVTGRKGTFDQGCGKLKLKAIGKDGEKKLGQLQKEFSSGNLTFWAQLIWATREGRLKKTEITALDKMVARVAEEFKEYLDL